MTIQLYRGAELYREEEVNNPGRQIWEWRVRHLNREAVGRYHAEQTTEDLPRMQDVIEVFQFDPSTGRYLSANFRELPGWVIRQEMQAQEKKDRRERFDRLTRMMMPQK